MNKEDYLVRNIIIGLFIVGVIGYFLLFFKTNSNTNSITQQLLTPPPTSLNSNCVTSQEAYNEIGNNACVEYYVGYATESRAGNVFLDEKTDYANGFSVTIYSGNVYKFNNPVSTYNGQTIDVTGHIQQYQGHPEIIVSNPSQITIK